MKNGAKQQAAPRLSLQDFKMKEVGDQKGLEKLMGGQMADSCHYITCGGSLLAGTATMKCDQ